MQQHRIDQHDTVRAIQWQTDHLDLLDQRYLPQKVIQFHCHTVEEVAEAITGMVVRGAPAIGITAAYGVVISAQQHSKQDSDWLTGVKQDIQRLAQTRPTAVNLFWALERMQQCVNRIDKESPAAVIEKLLEEAKSIHEEDIAANRQMGRLGAELIGSSVSVITHCNTGSLATGGFGTALGVIREAYQQGKVVQVYADETRPWLQGARLTAWELVKDNIPVKLIAEGAAASLMKQVKPQWVIVGSDRITANGDVANKIGTYSLAVLARQLGVGFMVVAPTSTVDMQLLSGEDIPIETRSAEELLKCGGQQIAAKGAGAWNPVFDVTPAELVDVIVTEKGIVKAPNHKKMLAMMQND